MHARTFDALTRQRMASALSTRRAAFLALAVAGALGVAIPIPAPARKRKKNRKTNKKNVQKLAAQQCQNQVGECLDIAPAVCGGNQQCLDNAPLCCPFLEECDITAFLGCVVANS